jgi:hypothetical protein
MGPDDPTKWAAKIAEELIVGGEHVPFERVLARHIATLKTLRLKTGLTWSGIAALLVRAGARRSDGKLLSADQIRVGYARLTRPKDAPDQPSEVPQSAPKLVPHQRPARGLASTNSRPKTVTPEQIMASDTAASLTRPMEATSKEDLSTDELTAALARLNKIK